MNSRSLLARHLLLGVCLVPGSAAFSQTVRTWNGGNGDWYDAARWSGGVMPDDANAEARIDGGKVAVSTVSLVSSNRGTVGRLVVDAGDTLRVDGTSLMVTDAGGFGTRGTIVNHGSIRVQHDPQLAGTEFFIEGNVGLSGSGTLTLDAQDDSYYASLGDWASQASLTNHSGHTIAGRGRVSLTTLTNNGTIDANTAQGQSNRVLGIYGNTLVNHSLIRARNSGRLVIGASQVQNSGGQIRCDAGTSGENVTITGSDVYGGELNNASGSGSADRFLLDNCFLDSVTLRGPIVAMDQTTVTLSGMTTIPSGSSLTLFPDPEAGHTNIAIDGDPDGNGSFTPVVLQGAAGAASGGTIRLGTAGNCQLYSDFNTQGHQLTNANLTLAGGGAIFLEKLTNNVNGVVQADVAGKSLALYSLFGGQWVNYGQMQAVSGGILDVHLPVLENKNGNGSLIAEAGSTVLIQGTRILGGNVLANGTGQVQLNGATLDGRPLGLTPDPVDLSGDVRFNSYNQLKGTIRTFGAATLTARQDTGSPYSSLNIYRTVSLEGSGRVKLQQDPLIAGATAYIEGADGDPGNILVLNIPVEGAGYIGNRFGGGLQQVEVNPNGVIKANLPGKSLELSYGTFYNFSALTAELGGTVKFERAEVVNLSGRGGIVPGQINVLPGSTVQFSHISNSVAGGTILNAGGNVWILGETSFSNLTINHISTPLRTVEVLSGSLTLGGTITNYGQIYAGEFGPIYINGNMNLNGNGSLSLNGSDIYGLTVGDTLIQGANHSLTGRGTIHCGFINNGIVVVPDNQTATFNGTISGSGRYTTNRGVIRFTGASPVASNGRGSGVRTVGPSGLVESSGGYQASGGGGIVANGGGNIVALGGNNIVAVGGGNVINGNGSTIVANGGGNIVAVGGGNIVAVGGGNLLTPAAIIALGGGNMLGNNIIANPGTNLVGLNGSNIVGSNAGAITAGGIPGAAAAAGPRNARDAGTAGVSRVLLGDGSTFTAGVIEIQTNAVLEITAGDPNADPENFVLPPDTISYGNIEGTFDLQTGGAWVADIGGTLAGQTYDQLTVTGAAMLDGELRVRMLNNFQQTITAANTFTILTATGGITGLPANTVNGRITTSDLFGTFAINLTAGGTALVLSDFQALPHPILAWAAGFGLTGADAQMTADPDRDGRNNLEEFAYLTNPANGGDMPDMPMERAGDQIVITFTRRCGQSHRLSYVPESTTNLTDWLTIAAPWTQIITPVNNITEAVTISGPASTARTLFRVKVTGL